MTYRRPSALAQTGSPRQKDRRPMGPYRQDACRRPYQDSPPLKVRSIDKAIEFSGYLTLNCYHII